MRNRPEVEQHQPQLSLVDYFTLQNKHEEVAGTEAMLQFSQLLGDNSLETEFKLAIISEVHAAVDHQLKHHAGEAEQALRHLSETVANQVGVDQTERNNARYARLAGLFARNNFSDDELATTEELSYDSDYDSRPATPRM